MTLAEYYGFPKGTNCMRTYYNIIDDGADYPIDNMSRLFQDEPRKVLPNLKNQQPTNIEYICANGNLRSLHGLQYLDTSKCTNMKNAFRTSSNITDLSHIKDWNTSNVTDMSNMFYSCGKITSFDVNWDTSNVTTMNQFIYNCSALIRICRLDCSSVTQNNYPIYFTSNNTTLTDVGGFINMKSSWTTNYGLYKCSNLTYESCINILNGLYDFTGNGETPSSTQGKLKVHPNFLTTVGDEIEIATRKNWVVTT